MSVEDLRTHVLRRLGARATVLDELVAYGQNRFQHTDLALPLPDEPFVADWEEHIRVAGQFGALHALRRPLIQLGFPIREGISRTDAYLAATRRGVRATGEGLTLLRPDELRLFLHPTAAGRIPVIVAAVREDFVALIRALTLKNEPALVPPAMGACIVGGYNDWDRIERLRAAWERSPDHGGHPDWSSAFRALATRRELYQDRFIVLSRGPYSAAPAAALGLDDDTWTDLSLTIRLEHECAHYFTRRAFGSMRNTLLDEIIADYAGIVAATGAFRADWFLRFLGLEQFPRYRPGARLENYRGTPPLSDAAFQILHALVYCAAHGLEHLHQQWFPGAISSLERTRVIARLSFFTLEQLACAFLPDSVIGGTSTSVSAFS